MIDTGVRRRAESYRALTELVAVEESRDGLVTVTTGVLGDLRDLRFHPRVAHCRDLAALAGTVLRTVRVAAASAHRSAAGLAEELMPDHPHDTEIDFLFGPLLHQLDRRIADGGAPGSDHGYDYAELRARILARRELAEEVRETVTSADGSVSATVGGRGALLDLTLGGRARPADQLADDILATVRRATARAADRLTPTRRT